MRFVQKQIKQNSVFGLNASLPCLNLPQQEDVVKLTEKCGLNSTGSSPVVTPLRTPEDLKSNILKAQAEAAVLKVGKRLW